MGARVVTHDSSESPPIWRWVVGFILVGIAWGMTTPFLRKAALSREKAQKPKRPEFEAILADPASPRLRRWIWAASYSLYDLVRDPAYTVPFLLNATGSVWFFVLIGSAELSLTVPITNSLAFLFTVLGEWWAEGKVISRDTWIGMAFVLAGIALCVHSKT